MDATSYRKIFRDIVTGRSEVKIDGTTFYVKHLSSLDQVDIDDIRLEYVEKAKQRGIPLKEDLLSILREDGVWSDSDEEAITKQELYIEQLRLAKPQLLLKSQIDNQNKNIEAAESELIELLNKKNDLIGLNAEDYADKRSNDHYVIKSFYEDSNLTKLVFPDEDKFNDLYSDDVAKFIQAYNKTFAMFEELKIQEMILQDFYYIYFPFSDDTVGFFGNPVCHLTYNQLKLIVYTKIFKNIFEQNQHIPEKIKKDPKALLDYGSISTEAKDKMKQKLSSDSAGTTLMGATKEDYEYAGLNESSSGSQVSLHEAAEKKGGSLSMEDLMELSGYKTK